MTQLCPHCHRPTPTCELIAYGRCEDCATRGMAPGRPPLHESALPTVRLRRASRRKIREAGGVEWLVYVDPERLSQSE